MIFVTLSLILGLVGVVYIWLQHHFSYWKRRNVPHETPKFFFGNMKGMGRDCHWRDINRRIYNKFIGSTPICGFFNFFGKSVFILDPELRKQIMVKDFGTFSSRGLFHNVQDDPLTGNLLQLDGEPWRILRHKLSPVFTSGKIKFMFPTIVEVGERLVDACRESLEKNISDIEIKDICARFTTDVIGTCAFGIDCNSLENPNGEFRQMGRDIFERPRHSLAVQAFMFTNPELARALHMKQFDDNQIEFFMNVVRETVDYREKNNVHRKDFMDMLVELKAKRDQLGEISGVDEFSNGLSIEQVAAQAMIFFLAGFDTSSTTMAFCIYELALNMEIQDKLRKEIHEVLGKHHNQITYEAIKEMSYLNKVLSETLRKHSVLPHIARLSVAEFKVPNTDIVLEKGIRIVIPVDAMHHDPKIYPSPEKFDPERFTPEEIAKRHPFSYLPFGEGPRNCIGERFGKLQAQIGIVSLVRHFKFSPTDRTEIPLPISLNGFLLAPKNGIYLKIEKL